MSELDSYYEDVYSYVDTDGRKRVDAPTDTHKLISRAQSDAFKAEQEAKEWRRSNEPDYTSTDMSNLGEVYSVLTSAQCGYLMVLQCYVSYDDGVIVHPSKNSDKIPMTKPEMMKTLQLDKKRSTFYDFLEACTNYGIILENEDGSYSVNERYHFRGTFNSRAVVKTYSVTLRRVYREVKASDIGLIYRMLPFVHMSTNALCENPLERDPRKIRWFTQRELAGVIGVAPDTLGKCVKRMRFDGRPVLAQAKLLPEDPTKFIFNPYVFYRQKSAPDGLLAALFSKQK